MEVTTKDGVYLQSLIEDGGTYGTDSPKSVKFSCTMKNACMSEYNVKSRNRNDFRQHKSYRIGPKIQ